jgi:hypothetical protein
MTVRHRAARSPDSGSRFRSVLGAGSVALTAALLALAMQVAGGPEHAVRVAVLAVLCITAIGIAGLLQHDVDTIRRLVWGVPAPGPQDDSLACQAFAGAPGSAVPAMVPVEVS